MLNEFKQYLLGIGKSENTALNYCDKVKLYFKWCLDSFGSEPQQLYRANVLDYISYMKTIKRYIPKSVNNHLSSLRSFNEFLIFSGRQTELAIVTIFSRAAPFTSFPIRIWRRGCMTAKPSIMSF